MIQIGTSLAGTGTVGASGVPSADSDRTPGTRLFGPGSTSTVSHNLHVDLTGVVIHAIGLAAGDEVTVQMVVGCKEGDLYEDLCIAGKKLKLSGSPCNNMLLIPVPGRYRLIYSGDNLGSFHVFAYQVSLDAMTAAMPILNKLLA